ARAARAPRRVGLNARRMSWGRFLAPCPLRRPPPTRSACGSPRYYPSSGRVRPERVWQAIHERFPIELPALRRLLAELDADEGPRMAATPAPARTSGGGGHSDRAGTQR